VAGETCRRGVRCSGRGRAIRPPKEVEVGFREESTEPVRSRRFQMRADLLSIGDDYWITDESDAKAYKVDGKAMRVRDTWVLEDTGGNEVAVIREKKLSIGDKLKIEYGGREATVRKKLLGLGEQYHVEVEGSGDLTVKGDIVGHEYKVKRDGDKIAEISKKWFRVRDTYGIEVDDDRDSVLVLAVCVAVEALARQDLVPD
jgi:uncharacterized protein YxjI